MAMTAAVKDEISRLPVTRTCCRKSEVSSILRFAGGLHLVSGRIVIEAELDTGIAARRLRQAISEVYGHESEIIVVETAEEALTAYRRLLDDPGEAEAMGKRARERVLAEHTYLHRARQVLRTLDLGVASGA